MSKTLEPADERLATLSLARLTNDELERVHLQLFFENDVPPAELAGSVAFRAISMLTNRLARMRREAPDASAEVQATRELIRLRQCVATRYAEVPSRESSDLSRLINAYRTEAGRGIHPRELEQWMVRMRAGPLDGNEVSKTVQQVASHELRALELPRDVASCWIMGTSQTIGPDDWRKRALKLRGPPGASISYDAAPTPPTRIGLLGSPRCLVTVIASMYQGGAFIEAFLRNICSQTIFCNWCELIIVDAASPDGEDATIRQWMSDYPNIRYIRLPERIGIYDAWNLAIKEARGEFLTNANLDDLRRHDSIEIQARTLQVLPEVNVVYQDVFYTLESRQSFDRVAAFGFRSHVPLVTPAVMLAFNPPHNAPMWRRRLHDDMGLFDTRYQSAGDYEFWLRCVAAGKVFHRVADPHVIYFQNPQGQSTRVDSPGYNETREITSKYADQLLLRAGLQLDTMPATHRPTV